MNLDYEVEGNIIYIWCDEETCNYLTHRLRGEDLIWHKSIHVEENRVWCGRLVIDDRLSIDENWLDIVNMLERLKRGKIVEKPKAKPIVVEVMKNDYAIQIWVEKGYEDVLKENASEFGILEDFNGRVTYYMLLVKRNYEIKEVADYLTNLING